MARALLIDLDDTLYDEASYVRSGFRAVTDDLARRFPQLDARRMLAAMNAELEAHGRGRVFDAVLADAGLAADPALIADLVQIYRDHAPAISLWPGVAEALADLRRDHRLAIITDGLGRMQRRKFTALGLERLVDEVVYCWEEDAPKPDPGAYREALQRFAVRAADAVVIGDRPDHDMAAAAAIGCRSIRVLTGRYAVADPGVVPADLTVADFAAAAQVLRGEEFGAVA